ncbi:TPA: thioredoxin family protein [Clostridium botulinum]|uniref:thioredoxin family protein n=1 Tax=Clostridium botulinum TaxID=1491 RepID=UPI000D0CE36B|nr:thioredoxin family protein [Clostridium botulinum]PSM03042.1 thioredoxin [Clostridium botulinum]HDK7137489.1 thioredoxin family protein [Clostridium botulinum]HDK7142749.1 thioredoxin family protein [Clostridium botulinum]HDK7146159.1 thioredoxin family protein [Clostridium botulinum]HDK7149865.1 thioredoxin family protein [Clostridium botulinum]
MEEIKNINYIENTMKDNSMVLIYFSSNEKCNVCTILKEKINDIGKKYNIEVFNVNIDNFKDAAGRYNVFTVPTTLFYIEGKEILREGRYISLIEFEEKIKRYCDLYGDISK